MMTATEPIGRVVFVAKECRHPLRCRAIALLDVGYREFQVQAISMAGDSTAIKAACAVLHTKGWSKLELHDIPGISPYSKCSRDPDQKFRTFKTQLARGVWHCVAIANRTDLLLSNDDDTLWSVLRSGRFTTPLLRSWTPWIREQLEQSGELSPLNCWECDAALLTAETELLDQIVSHGVACGALKLAA